MQTENQFSKTELIDYILLVLRKRKWMFFLIGFFTFFFVIFFTYLITPTWEGTAKILVERNSKQSLGIFKDITVPVSGGEGSAALDLIPLLTGTNMAYDVVKEFSLDGRLKEKRFHPKNLREHIKNIMVDIMLSPITMLQTIGVLEKGERNWVDAAVEDFTEDWQDIEAEEGTSVIDITIYGETPELAMEIPNRMVELLKERTQSFTNEGARASYEFVKNQLRVAEKNLREAEDALAKFRKREGVILIDEEKKLKLSKLNEFESELLSTEKQRKEIERSLAEVDAELKQQPGRIAVSTIIERNPVLTELESKLQSQEIKLAALLTEKGENHSEVKKLKAEIAKNKEAIKSIVQNITQTKTESLNPIFQELLSKAIDLRTEVFVLDARQKALKKIIKDIREELRSLPDKELELGRLKEMVAINSSIYQALKTRLEELSVEKESRNNEYNIRVLDRAYVSPSASPDWPMWALNIIAGLFLAFVFGIVTIFFVEYWNDSIINARQVREDLSLPYLGAVPEIKEE